MLTIIIGMIRSNRMTAIVAARPWLPN